MELAKLSHIWKLKPKRKKESRLGEFRQKLQNLKIRAFEPKIRFETQFKDYMIKTAETPEELRDILRLRYAVFIKEGLGQSRLTGIDFDRYDLMGDHIYLKDLKNNVVLGTYRLLSSRFSDDFYSQNEFQLDRLLELPGKKLELGRACIHQDHRNGAAIHLVWKGLAKYISLSQSDYLFGCSSVQTTSRTEAFQILENLGPESFDDSLEIEPTPKYRFPEESKSNFLHEVGPPPELPPLLKSYLKAGAKIMSEPALDRAFECTDFFTVLDVHQLNPRYVKKYFESQSD